MMALPMMGAVELERVGGIKTYFALGEGWI